MRTLSFAATLLAMCASSACDRQTTDPGAALRVSLNSNTYVAVPVSAEAASWQFTLVAATKNVSRSDVVIPLCNGTPYYGFELATHDGDSAYDPIYACELQTTKVTLTAGETRTDTIVISAPHSVDDYTHVPDGAFKGMFVLTISSESGPGRSEPVRVGIVGQ